VPKIYEILSPKYVLTHKGRKKQPRGSVPDACAPREVMQMDTIHFGQVCAFTAVDIKEADVLLLPSLRAKDGLTFLQTCLPRRLGGFVQRIQTDGGSELEAEFAQAVGDFCHRHRVSRPNKKNEQSAIESVNRTLRSACLGWAAYRPQEIGRLTPHVDAFVHRYPYHRPPRGWSPMRAPRQK
jgi:hypothetical protein